MAPITRIITDTLTYDSGQAAPVKEWLSVSIITFRQSSARPVKSERATRFWTVQIVSKIKMIILQDPDWNLKPFIEILNICGSKAEG